MREQFQFTRDAFAVRKPRRRAQRRADDIRVIKVDPQVWATAMRLAEGDAHRIEVISAVEVVVHNRR